MSRNNGSRRSSSQHRGSAPHQFLVVIVTFLLGYLTATVWDIQTVSHWINMQVMATQELSQQEVKPVPTQPAIPPKPKFEFYTLLTNEKNPNQVMAHAKSSQDSAGNTSSPSQVAANAAVSSARNANTVKVTEGKPIAPLQSGSGAYLVQVASFKLRQDAEHMKGVLTLRGFNVNIEQANQSQGNWFRVVVGPYSNRSMAQEAQIALDRSAHLKGILRSVRG